MIRPEFLGLEGNGDGGKLVNSYKQYIKQEYENNRCRKKPKQFHRGNIKNKKDQGSRKAYLVPVLLKEVVVLEVEEWRPLSLALQCTLDQHDDGQKGQNTHDNGREDPMGCRKFVSNMRHRFLLID
jgi:hypothetical protein